jgi:hypothetical protein
MPEEQLMNNQSNISPYLCRVVGETPHRAERFHASTVRRTKAFAIAIHIPVLLWLATGYLIAFNIFQQPAEMATVIALVCGGLIYMVERLVLATPKNWYVNLTRIFIGVVISVLGATAVDLVIFDREVTQQWTQSQENALVAEQQAHLARLAGEVAQKKDEWFSAKEAANCEANGTCGSMVRSVGPVYRELARQAEFLRKEYVQARALLAQEQQNSRLAVAQWRANAPSAANAGLLARVEALHNYTQQHSAALAAWALFFTLVLFLELMVVFCKLVFGETVDDQIEQMREQISHKKALDYKEAITSPGAGALTLIEASYR